ncbi:metallophosphoesterase [Devosia sp.]|uniref:metallophosphoesterase n=1 Tax=Devosia sp. TaxID=1871048 RepID=UPI003A90782B
MLQRLGGRSEAELPDLDAPERRLSFDPGPDTLYVIGDVHGCLAQLKALEARIVADAEHRAGENWIVMLGDLVDRGPDSAAVIDHMLTSPPAGFQRQCLMGNHEAAMLAFIARPRRGDRWLEFGGVETLLSYGVPLDALEDPHLPQRQFAALVQRHIPDEHIAFMSGLPLLIETPEAILCHAGLMPGVPLAAQSATDLIWYRDDFAADYLDFGKVVVHGHTIREAPLVTPGRIAIDTGAFATGRLTAVRLARGEPPFLIDTSSMLAGS